MPPSNAKRFSILLGAIGITSFASILIKLADAPALVVATYRLVLAMIVLAPLALAHSRDEFKKLSRRDLGLSLLSGAFLSLHFISWISSLDYTSVASSIVLFATNPIFVGLGSYLILREQLHPTLIWGIGLAIGGGVLIGYGDFQGGSEEIHGDLLALGGAVSVAAYVLIGRRVRQKVDLLTYITVVYGMAAVLLLIAALATHQAFTGYSRETYLWMVLLALGPQLLGHTSYNWALQYMAAAVVSVALLGEPVGSTILAYLILNEGLTVLKIVGGLLIISGIYLVAGGKQT
ncbi:MAG: DMT family transporter [Candidatus Bipolaricaulia bacterium]